MSVLHRLFVVFLCGATSGFGQINQSVFFRISGSSDAVITGFYPRDRTLSYSNVVAGTTHQLQRSFDLTATNGWMDCILLQPNSPTATEITINFCMLEGMVFISGGINSGIDPDFGAYRLSVSSFYMDKYEVTKQRWDRVYNWAVTNGYSFDNAGLSKAINHPVHEINWYDCVKWCNARSQMEGKAPCYTVDGSTYTMGESKPDINFDADGYRLPTIEEWEYAARGGLNGKRFPWGDTITPYDTNYIGSHSGPGITRGEHPSYNDKVDPYTSPEGRFPPNAYGLYDMSGNLSEWCTTEYTGSSLLLYNIKGGAWLYSADQARCGYVLASAPEAEGHDIGFRTVCY